MTEMPHTMDGLPEPEKQDTASQKKHLLSKMRDWARGKIGMSMLGGAVAVGSADLDAAERAKARPTKERQQYTAVEADLPLRVPDPYGSLDRPGTKRQPQRKVEAEAQPDAAEDPNVQQLPDGSWLIKANPVEKNGEGWRGPSEYPPEGYELNPIVLEQEAKFDTESRKRARITVLYPLPRNMGETAWYQANFNLNPRGFKEGSKMKVKIVTSQPNNNQFIEATIYGPNDGEVTLHPTLIFWATQASQSPIEESALLKTPGGSKHPLLKALAGAKQQTKNSIRYDGSAPKTLNAALVAKMGRGDCGAMASYLNTLMRGHTDVVTGWDVRGIDDEPDGDRGPHVWTRSKVGGWIADPSGNYLGRDNNRHIPGVVGTVFAFPKDSAFKNKRYAFALNRAQVLDGPSEKEYNTRMVLSVPGHGPRGAELALLKRQMSLKPTEEFKNDVFDAHNDFVKERTEINRSARMGTQQAASNPQQQIQR